MNRDILINFIPEPKNEDVILYNTSLKNLIDIDVIKEYNDLLPVFNFRYQQYLGSKNNIELYEKKINGIYLFKPNWREEDYLYNLQNEKKTYSTLFGPIKKIESNIEILQKKINMIDDKIEIQIAKETKDIEDKKKNIDKRIDELVDKIINIKEIISTLKIEEKTLNENIKESEEDFIVLQNIVENIAKGECKCAYCGHKLSNVSENSLFYKKTVKNIENNKKQLEKLLENKSKNIEKLSSYENNLKELKEELNNCSKFKSQDFNFYQKKSTEVLKLEGIRDSMLNNISKLKKELENHSETKSRAFLDIKNTIEKYELSLDNLKKIKDMKYKMQEELTQFNEIKEDILKMKSKMDQYKEFISIYYKIYEQKAAEFCGKEFKFKIFDFDNYNLIEKFEIYYNNIEYNNLTPKSKKIVETTLEEKFLFYE